MLGRFVVFNRNYIPPCQSIIGNLFLGPYGAMARTLSRVTISGRAIARVYRANLWYGTVGECPMAD